MNTRELRRKRLQKQHFESCFCHAHQWKEHYSQHSDRRFCVDVCYVDLEQFYKLQYRSSNVTLNHSGNSQCFQSTYIRQYKVPKCDSNELMISSVVCWRARTYFVSAIVVRISTAGQMYSLTNSFITYNTSLFPTRCTISFIAPTCFCCIPQPSSGSYKCYKNM